MRQTRSALNVLTTRHWKSISCSRESFSVDALSKYSGRSIAPRLHPHTERLISDLQSTKRLEYQVNMVLVKQGVKKRFKAAKLRKIETAYFEATAAPVFNAILFKHPKPPATGSSLKNPWAAALRRSPCLFFSQRNFAVTCSYPSSKVISMPAPQNSNTEPKTFARCPVQSEPQNYQPTNNIFLPEATNFRVA